MVINFSYCGPSSTLAEQPGFGVFSVSERAPFNFDCSTFFGIIIKKNCEMDWIHCNMCFIQPKNGDVTKGQFFVTSCGHLFCGNCGCFEEGTSNCKSCRSQCSCTLLGEKAFQTNPQLNEYFQDAEEACDKLLRIISFQKAHRDNLIRHRGNTLSKYNKPKSCIKKLKSELTITKNALQNTPLKLCSFEENFATSTPIFNSNLSPFKMIDAAASRCTPSLKQRTPHKNNRKHLFQNELSIISTESIVSENWSIQTSSSSVNASSMQDHDGRNNMLNIGNPFWNRQFTRYNSDA